MAWLFFQAGGGQLLPEASSLLHKVALAKTQATIGVLIAKGMLCNWLVCLAIWMCQRVEGAAKFIAIWWCLLAFIASGYEHSIANMTIFALSWFGAHGADYNLSGIGYNLLWVTLGNTLSGVVFMGVITSYSIHYTKLYDNGIPRFLDVGQCNDAYSAIQLALALAEEFGCGVNELPLSRITSYNVCYTKLLRG